MKLSLRTVMIKNRQVFVRSKRSAGRVHKSLSNFFSYHKRPILVLKFIVIFLIFWASSRIKNFDPDFGWHLQAGNYIRSHGAVPGHDLYTYTAHSFRWINHEWLSDALMSKLYSGFGYSGLVIIYAAVWSAAFFIARISKRWIFLIATVLTVLPYSGVRATTWTVFFLSIMLAILASKRKRLRYLLPPLFLIWANMHGGFFIGLIVLAFYMVKERRIFWLYILAACAVATFINPYGPRLYDEIIRTVSDNRAHWQIQEWFPALFLFNWISFLYCGLWALGYLIKYGPHPKNYMFKLSPWFFVASLSSNRHFPLFVLASTSEIDGLYANLKSKLPRNLDKPKKAMIAILPIVFVSVACLNLYNVVNTNAYTPNPSNGYPVKAVSYLKDHPCSGNLFNHYNYGGFLIWQLPNTPVYIDGRIPVWKDENGIRYFDRYNKVGRDKDAARSSDFKRYDIRCVLWPNEKVPSNVVESVKKAGWKKIDAASDNAAVLWVAP